MLMRCRLSVAACFALFILFYMLFTKIFPIISIWEIREGREEGVHEVTERVKSYLPDVAVADPPAAEPAGSLQEEGGVS